MRLRTEILAALLALMTVFAFTASPAFASSLPSHVTIYHQVTFGPAGNPSVATIDNVLNLNGAAPPTASIAKSLTLFSSRSGDGSMRFSLVTTSTGVTYYGLVWTGNSKDNATVISVLMNNTQDRDYRTVITTIVTGSNLTVPIGDQYVSHANMTLSDTYSNLAAAVGLLSNTYMRSNNSTLSQLGKEYASASKALEQISNQVQSRALARYNLVVDSSFSVTVDDGSCVWVCTFSVIWLDVETCVLAYVFGLGIGGILCTFIVEAVGTYSCYETGC